MPLGASGGSALPKFRRMASVGRHLRRELQVLWAAALVELQNLCECSALDCQQAMEASRADAAMRQAVHARVLRQLAAEGKPAAPALPSSSSSSSLAALALSASASSSVRSLSSLTAALPSGSAHTQLEAEELQLAAMLRQSALVELYVLLEDIRSGNWQHLERDVASKPWGLLQMEEEEAARRSSCSQQQQLAAQPSAQPAALPPLLSSTEAAWTSAAELRAASGAEGRQATIELYEALAAAAAAREQRLQIMGAKAGAGKSAAPAASAPAPAPPSSRLGELLRTESKKLQPARPCSLRPAAPQQLAAAPEQAAMEEERPTQLLLLQQQLLAAQKCSEAAEGSEPGALAQRLLWGGSQ